MKTDRPNALALERLARPQTRKAQPAKLDPMLELFAQGRVDIYEQRTSEEE
jgi:hypothetical protein